MSLLPHKIQVADAATFFASALVEFASADTADVTQRKRLCRRGADTYVVARCYVEETVWTDVYRGPDLEAAVGAYNGLG